MNICECIDVSCINITVHARKRWAERGYLGDQGLLYELKKATELDEDSAQYDEDLQDFLRVEKMYRHQKDGKRYYYTTWFIFIIGNATLITCIARNYKVKKVCGKSLRCKRLKRR